MRLTLLTRLFLALGIEAEAERLEAWASATQELPVAQLELRCATLARRWREKGAPRPADVLAAVEAAGASPSARKRAPMWEAGVHRATGERVLGDGEIAARYRRLGCPCAWDTSAEAQSIRERRSNRTLGEEVAAVRARRLAAQSATR